MSQVVCGGISHLKYGKKVMSAVGLELVPKVNLSDNSSLQIVFVYYRKIIQIVVNDTFFRSFLICHRVCACFLYCEMLHLFPGIGLYSVFLNVFCFLCTLNYKMHFYT